MDRKPSKLLAYLVIWTAFCPYSTRLYNIFFNFSLYIMLFKIILKIIIIREKLKKTLYSLIEYGQKAVQITRQANNLDGFLSIWSASRPIFDRKSLNCYSKSKFRAISYLSILPPPLFQISRNSI